MVTDRSTSASTRLEPHDLTKETPARRVSAPPDSSIPPALDWGDAAAVNAWARDVYTQARDAIDAGEDATRPPGKRELGRAAARRILREALDKLDSAFRYAGIGTGEGAP